MNHEILDDSVKLASLVTDRKSSFSVLAGAELPATKKRAVEAKVGGNTKRRRSLEIICYRERTKAGYLKFSAVLGAMSAKSSILIRPAGMVPMVMSKNTMGFLGFGGRTCHSTPPPADAINVCLCLRLFANASEGQLSRRLSSLWEGSGGGVSLRPLRATT